MIAGRVDKGAFPDTFVDDGVADDDLQILFVPQADSAVVICHACS